MFTRGVYVHEALTQASYHPAATLVTLSQLPLSPAMFPPPPRALSTSLRLVRRADLGVTCAPASLDGGAVSWALAELNPVLVA